MTMWCQTCQKPLEGEAQEGIHRIYDHVLEDDIDLTEDRVDAILGPEVTGASDAGQLG